MATLPATVTTGSYLGAQGTWNGPYIDGNGNYYVVLINNTFDQYLEMWKSSNGGETWAKVDDSNHPVQGGSGGAYCVDLVQIGTVLHIASFEYSLRTVYYHTFNTSDAVSNPDTWQTTDETVVDYTDTASEYSCNIVVNPDGDRFIHANGDDGTYYSTRECTEYNYNTGAGWSTKHAMGDTDSDNIIAGLCIGENGKIHLVWKEEASTRYNHASLTDVDATPSADEVCSSGVTANSYNYTTGRHLVYYDASGVERITFAFMASDETPYSTIIEDDGTPDTPEQISTTTVHRGSSNLHSAAMNLCVDAPNDTVWLIFADATTQDIYVKKNIDDGGWTGETEIWDAVACDLLSANIFVRDNGDTVIGYFIDDGGVQGTIKYNEYVVAEAAAEDLNISIASDAADHQIRGVKITA